MKNKKSTKQKDSWRRVNKKERRKIFDRISSIENVAKALEKKNESYIEFILEDSLEALQAFNPNGRRWATIERLIFHCKMFLKMLEGRTEQEIRANHELILEAEELEDQQMMHDAEYEAKINE